MKFDYPPKPLTLKGVYVTLLPMNIQYLNALQDAVADGALWKLWYTFVPRPEEMESWIVKAIKEQSDGISIPSQSKEIVITGSLVQPGL